VFANVSYWKEFYGEQGMKLKQLISESFFALESRYGAGEAARDVYN
jgi:hypothetical protein